MNFVFDSHAHYFDRRFENEYEGGAEALLSRIYPSQVSRIINVGTDCNSSRRAIAQAAKLENKPLPADIDYDKIEGLRIEARQKLNKIRPANLGQAGRISGVSPADVQILIVWLAQRK